MFFNPVSIEFVANHALLVALNLSRITHFWCKFLGPQKAAGVNVLPFCNSGWSHDFTRLAAYTSVQTTRFSGWLLAHSDSLGQNMKSQKVLSIFSY